MLYKFLDPSGAANHAQSSSFDVPLPGNLSKLIANIEQIVPPVLKDLVWLEAADHAQGNDLEGNPIFLNFLLAVTVVM